jgi:hypothetical protein
LIRKEYVSNVLSFVDPIGLEFFILSLAGNRREKSLSLFHTLFYIIVLWREKWRETAERKEIIQLGGIISI